MDWNLKEAIAYYQTQGAPKDQTVLISLLREVQHENNGSIPLFILEDIARNYDIKVSFLMAIVKRIPSLRLDSTHCLELCAGPNCGKHAELTAYAEKRYANSGKKFSLRFRPCMRMCGKGPNLKWDGEIYHAADIPLLEKLLSEAGIHFLTNP